MDTCVCCDTIINRSEQFYVVDDLGHELSFLLEQRLNREIPIGSILCSNCMAHILRIYEERVYERCVSCERQLGRQVHTLNDGAEYNEIAAQIEPRQIPPNGRVCHSCWISVQRRIERERRFQQNVTAYLRNYRRTPNSQSRCFVRGCVNRERLIPPLEYRKEVLRSHKLFITTEARICLQHLIFCDWDEVDIINSYLYNFDLDQIDQMLQLLSGDKSRERLDFENIHNLTEGDCHYWLGLSKREYLDFLERVPMIGEVFKKPKTALAMYLLKLRTGEPNTRVGELFDCTEGNVRFINNKVRSILTENFVPSHLGINHLTRNDHLQRNLLIPEGLFGSNGTKAITICDGTYLQVQKSSNYLFQKQTYSLHKFHNLVKPFLMVASDGHIIDVFGPYAAVTSDADIIKKIFQENDDVRNYFEADDVFILDRGFRDALEYLESLNYVVYKPESLGPNESQLSTIKANRSRCVTLCRWVVEVVNGRFKRDFKIFRNAYFNRAAAHLMQDFRIAAAILNVYYPLLQDRPDAHMILDRANQFIDVPNTLGQLIVSNRINRRTTGFQRINGNLPQLDIFPEMNMSELILVSLGTYQIKQARSYYGEHIRPNGVFYIEINEQIDSLNITPNSDETQQLIRVRIKSRFSSRRKYYAYILINPNGANWDQKIAGYYCTCYVGMRTVGCCAHIMTVVWYLGWARHQANTIEAPASFLDGILVNMDE